MSIYLPTDGKTYRYRFKYKGQWYRGSTGQRRKSDAKRFDEKEQLRVRQEGGGIAEHDPTRTPHIQQWAEIYYREAAKRVDRPERIKDLVRVVLRFWGAKPKPGSAVKPKDGEPYHNLRLADPILDPRWILKFEDWMDLKGWAGQTKNQYRSAMSQMYVLAQSPLWRKTTHVQMNPFVGLARDSTVGREVTMTPEDLRAFLNVASYHVRLAVAIGALAPKLRLDNILKLRWSQHFDRHLQYITVWRHKTAKRTRRPLVIAVSQQLREILKDARQRSRTDYVITFKGEPVTEIRGGVRGASTRAGLPYGRHTENGLTFHVLRHTAATLMADLDLSDEKRRRAMGHEHASTTQRYTHLRPAQELDTMEQLSQALPIADLVTKTWRRPPRVPDPLPDPLMRSLPGKSGQNEQGARAPKGEKRSTTAG